MTRRPRLTRVALGLVAGLVLGSAARAEAPIPAEAVPLELTAVFECAAAMGLYKGYMEDPRSVLTDADRALATDLAAVEPRLRDRGQALAIVLGDEPAGAIIALIRADMTSRIAPLRGDPDARRKVIDLYRPVLSACVVRGAALPPT